MFLPGDKMSSRILDLCAAVVQPGDKIVAAVSGGADSLCMAHALQCALKFMDAQLLIAHVNHQLRGEDADADARFVCTWAEEMGLPRAVVKIDVRRQGGESLQSIAQDQRYAALRKICHDFGANKLATAHHADDQVETFLLNLLRGSGSRGLKGIPPERRLDAKVKIIRPLLSVNRTEIEQYCAENQLKWRTDVSNDSLYYQRNRIRHQLLPQLRSFNSGVDKVLLNTIDNLRKDQELLAELTAQALERVEEDSSLFFAPRALSSQGLAGLPPALQNRVVLDLLPEDCESAHVDAVLDLIKAQTGSSVDLPGRHRAYRLHDSIAIGGLPPEDVVTDTSVPIPGRSSVGEFTLVIDTQPFPNCQEFYLPNDSNNIVVGSRRPGDYIHLPGGGKKLKDFMIDRKVPRWLRDRYMVFRTSGAVFWVPGLGRDQRFVRPGPGRRAVYIKFNNRRKS